MSKKNGEFHVERVFTEGLSDPYQGIDFEQRDSIIRQPNGDVVFKMRGIWVPTHWSPDATRMLIQKYLRKAGVPSDTVRVEESGVPVWLQRSVPAAGAELGFEKSLKDVFHRMAGCWTYWIWKSGLFDSESSARVFYEEIVRMLVFQVAAPNSPQWFNTGLHWAYGLMGPAQGHYHVPIPGGPAVASTNAYEHPQVHACYIQACQDELVGPGGIMDLWVREARLFKYGSGTGTNFSRLRGQGEKLSGGGASSGLMSWLAIGDRAAAAVQSGGTTRRAAKMVLVDVDHPDILDFIHWKVEEEHKVASLVVGSHVLDVSLSAVVSACWPEGSETPSLVLSENKALRRAIRKAREAGVPEARIIRELDLVRMGNQEYNDSVYNTSWEGVAYQTVGGQQANNSVRVTDKFLRAVKEDQDWSLLRRTDGSVSRTLPAREVWAAIVDAAWCCGDPALQYHDTTNAWHTCRNDGEIVASNPCSEYLFFEETACNLASLNLVYFIDWTNPSRPFLMARYLQAILLWTVVLDVSVTMSQLPSQAIAEGTDRYRTLGLGYANLGAFLMRNGIPYDSERGRCVAAALTSLLTGEAYRTSAMLAGILDPFPRYPENRTSMEKVIHQHVDVCDRWMAGLESYAPLERGIWSEAHFQWENAKKLGRLFGYRNAQVTCLAPTGTISFVMDCDTTGCEPDYSLVKFKSLAGGGYLGLVNHSVRLAFETLGYSAEVISRMITALLGTRKIQGDWLSSLVGKGFTPEMIDRVERDLPTSYHVSFAVTPEIVGKKECTEYLGIPQNEIGTEDVTLLGTGLLSRLGFSSTEIEAFNTEVCGCKSMEFVSELSPEHLPVFDCASRSGLGTRTLSVMGHLLMMEVLQPFLSGGISKTVNLPRDATRETVAEVYAWAWEHGLKSIAIYRDGSKLSQPLSSGLVERMLDAGSEDEMSKEKTVEEVVRVAEKISVRYLAKRRRLPYRRRGYTQKVTIQNQKLFLHTGEYEDENLGEIFITTNKEGATVGALMNAFCVAISIGLQHGVPLERFVNLFCFWKFDPQGPVKGDDRIKMCTSLIDYVFRHLAVHYLGRDDLAHVSSEDALVASVEEEPEWEEEEIQEVQEAPLSVNVGTAPTQTVSKNKAGASPPKNETDVTQEMGYTGEMCPLCGHSTLVREGPCVKCRTCGANPGCS
jgi:ribonucleoside-diphosphate reductase alpha chain